MRSCNLLRWSSALRLSLLCVEGLLPVAHVVILQLQLPYLTTYPLPPSYKTLSLVSQLHQFKTIAWYGPGNRNVDIELTLMQDILSNSISTNYPNVA